MRPTLVRVISISRISTGTVSASSDAIGAAVGCKGVFQPFPRRGLVRCPRHQVKPIVRAFAGSEAAPDFADRFGRLGEIVKPTDRLRRDTGRGDLSQPSLAADRRHPDCLAVIAQKTPDRLKRGYR